MAKFSRGDTRRGLGGCGGGGWVEVGKRVEGVVRVRAEV